MLPGERTRGYVTSGGDLRAVCDLCTVRARSAGWAPADQLEERPVHTDEGSKLGRRWRSLFRRAAGRPVETGAEPERAPRSEAKQARGEEAKPPPPAEVKPAASRPQRPAAPRAERKRPAAAAKRRPGTAGAREGGKRQAPVRRGGSQAKVAAKPKQGTRSPPGGAGAAVRPKSDTPERRIRQAIDGFNRSQYRRTVEGLTRSMGRPRVAAIAPSKQPDRVRLTVAWDLSWYQWEVKLSNSEARVRTIGHGQRISELGAADQAWNARAGEDGRLQLGLGGDGATA